jgi:thiol:disulfide interchange protein
MDKELAMRLEKSPWTWKTLIFGLGVLGLASVLGIPHGLAGGKGSATQVKIAATASKLDETGKQNVNISLDINKGWHLYANPINNADFISLQTVVTINAKVKPANIQVMYPPGKLHQDKVVGDYKVYEDKVNIQATVQRAPGDTSPLEVAIRFNACNDKGQCLPPSTVKLNVP